LAVADEAVLAALAGFVEAFSVILLEEGFWPAPGI